MEINKLRMASEVLTWRTISLKSCVGNILFFIIKAAKIAEQCERGGGELHKFRNEKDIVAPINYEGKSGDG